MKNPLRSSIAVLIAVAFSTSGAFAARSSSARLTVADHKVSVVGKPVALGTLIAPGDTITTGSRSHAEVTLPDGTVARIGQGSSFTYTGAKLVLNQGTALIHTTRKGTTVVSGSRTYTGGPAVVSAEVSKKTDGLYILQGGGKVNGVTLIPGQSSVLERGKERTFTFDLQKMEASSALVTKFPQTPWVVQTQALALVQHQLLTAKVTPAGKSRPQAASDVVAGRLASIGNAASATTKSVGVVSPGGSALQFIGGPISLGADKVAVIKSAVISTVTNGGALTSAGSLTVSGVINNTTVSGGTITAGLNTAAIGTLTLNGGTLDLGTSRSNSGSSGGTLNFGISSVGSTSGPTITAGATTLANFTVNTGISAGILTVGNPTTIASGSGAVLNLTGTNTFTSTIASGSGALIKTGAGVVNLAGSNTYTGTTTVDAGTLNVNNGGTLGFRPLTLANNATLLFTNPNTTVANIGTISPTTIQYPTGGVIVFGGATLPQQAGQIVTLNGVTYTTLVGPSGGTITLQRAAQ